MTTSIQQLDPTQRSLESREFEQALRARIVGQEEALRAVVDLYQVFRMEMNSPGRPVGNLLFLGPTGAGKTRMVPSADALGVRVAVADDSVSLDARGLLRAADAALYRGKRKERNRIEFANPAELEGLFLRQRCLPTPEAPPVMFVRS
jgi:GGDEF domain-containing protein